MKTRLPIISFVAAIITMVIGILVIIGWFTHNDFLRMIVPGQVKMKFNVALGFVFSSMALLLYYSPAKNETGRRLAIVLSVLVSLVGLLTLVEYIFRFNTGIDELFVQDELRTTAVYYAGRMSPLAALNFVFLGTGLLLLNKEKTASYQFYYLTGIAFVSLLMLIGFNFITDIPTYFRLAIHVAIGFITLSAAIWFAQPMLQKKISFERKLVTGFSAVIILIAVFSIFSYYYSNKRISITRWIRHTNSVLSEAEQTLSLTKDIQSGGRGYIITGDSSYLEFFTIAKNSLSGHVKKLQELTKDSPDQQARIDSLSALVDKRIGFSEKLIQVRNEKGFEAANNLVTTGLGNFYTNEIRRVTAEIQQKENDLLTQRQIENNKSIVFFQRAFIVLLASVFLFLVIIYFSIRNNIITRKKAEEKFKKSEKNFELLVSSVKDYAIYMLDGDGCVKSWNSGAEYIKGYTEKEIIGKPLDIFYTTEEKQRGEPQRNLQRALEHGHYETEGLRVRKDGSTFYANIVFTSLVDESGKPFGYAKVTRDITEKRKAEEHIRLLASIADNIQDPVIASDNNFCTTSWNEAAEKLFGWKSEEVIGKPTREVLRIIYPNNGREQILQSFTEKGYWQGEVIYHTKSGKPLNVLATASQLKDAHETVTGILVLVKDITDRKKTEKQLEEFGHFFNNSHDLCGIANTVGYFEIINANFSKVLGYSEQEFCETPFIELIHPDDIAVTLHEYEKLKSGELTINFINRYRKKDGSYLHLDWNATPNPLTGKLYCVARDITDRKKAEEQIAYLARLVEGTNEAVYSVTTDFHIRTWNKGAENLYGFTAAETIGKPVFDIIRSHMSEAERLIIREEIRKHGHWKNELEHIKKDGSSIYILASATATLNAMGEIEGYVSVGRDITDRKKAEEALNKLNAELEQRVRERTTEIEKKEKRFRALIENNYDIISLMDEQFNVFYRSPSAARITGWTDEEILNIDGTKNIHPDDSEKAGLIVKELMAHPGKALHTLFRNQHKDGHYLWVEGTVINLLQDEDVKAIVFNFRDITQRKKLEDLLHKANLLARIGGWEIDVAKGKVYWSDITREIHETEYSYVPDLETGIHFYKQGKGRDLITEKVKEAIEFGKPWDLELQIITAKNNERWIRTIGETEFVNGKCVRIYGSFQDIDQRKKTEEKLTTERALLRTLIDNLPDYIYVKDTRSRHLINNKANVELLSGSTEKETIGKTVNDFLAPEMAISYLEDDQFVFQSGKPIINKEEMILSPTGETKYLLTTKVPLRDEDNSIIGLVGISRDITWQKEIELDLRQKKYFLEKAQEVGQIGYWISEIGGAGKLTWSEETCRIFGTEPAEFDGQLKTFFSFIHPEDIDRLNSATSYAVENNLTYRVEHRIILRNGATRWVYEQGEATYDENGKALLIIGIVQDITERKEEEEKRIKNEELIRLAEANYRELFDKANDGIYVHELETGRVVNINHRATELNGFSKEELLTGDPRDFMTDHPDYTFEKAIDYIQKAAAGEPQFFEWLGRCKDGSSSWFEMNLKKTSIGGKDRILAFQRDINDRKKVEEALRKSEARARRIFESDMIGFIFWNEQGQILEANDYFLRMTGYDREDLGKGLVNWATMTPPEYENLDIIAIEQIADTGICKPFEKEYIRKDGSRIPISLGAAALGANFDGVGVCYVMDISERIKATETIAEALKEKNSILESIGDAFFAVDKNWTVTYWNRIAEIALGVLKQDIVGKNLWEIFSDSIESLSYQKYHQALATNQVVHFEDFYAALDKWYEISAYPSGNGLSVYFKDVTERQKAAGEIKKLNAGLEEKVISRTGELKKVNEELEAFTYSVSHDLRAPLRGIIGFTTILEEDYSSKLDEEARRITGVIKSNTLKMGNLIDDLLTFSRMGRQDIEKNLINTNEMVKEIVNNLENENTAGSIEWIISSLHDAYGDSNTIRQVWINLIANAIKYSGGKTNQLIEIGSALLKGQTTFFVKDNGVGFDIKYSSKLFKVFQRLHGNNEFEGTGVGLAIVEKIVSKHGGKVWATGEVDKGAVFYFSLPAKQ